MLDQTMERRIARNFYNKAKQLIPDDGERELMFTMLRNYQQTYDLAVLLDELKEIINEPIRLELFDAIRPLIPLKHQLEYDRLVPHIPNHKLRVIRLQRRTNESLGFSVRGGYEHGVGIYVSEVDPDTQAYHYGLRVGDEVVRVNGFTISQAIHEEVLNLIKARPEIVLKVRTVGMLPRRENISDNVSWKFVEGSDHIKHSMSWHMSQRPSHPKRYSRLYVNLRGVGGLGCSICSGPAEFPGVFLQSIKAGSLAEEAGLAVGDQLIDVNGTSFFNITHSEAVVALKSSSELYITLQKGAGLKLFQPSDGVISAQHAAEEDKIKQFQNRERGEKESGDILRRFLAEEEVQREENNRQQEEEKRKHLLEKHEEERKERLRLVRESEEKKKNELEQMRAKQDRLRKEATEKARELEELKRKEKLSLELKKKQEIQEKRSKRLEKEQTHLQKIDQQNKQKIEKEQLLRLERQQREREEILREEQRMSNVQLTTSTPITRVWRPVEHVYMPRILLDQTDDVEDNYFYDFQSSPREGGLPDITVTSPSISHTSNNSLGKSVTGPSFDHRPLEINNAEDEEDLNFDPKKLFNPMEIGGREVNLIKVKRDGPLDIDIEGGMGTPLGGKIVISEIYEGGAVHKHGGIHRGDQLMMVDGLRLVDVTLAEAQSILDRVATRPGSFVKIVVAKAPPKLYEDEITYL